MDKNITFALQSIAIYFIYSFNILNVHIYGRLI